MNELIDIRIPIEIKFYLCDIMARKKGKKGTHVATSNDP